MTRDEYELRSYIRALIARVDALTERVARLEPVPQPDAEAPQPDAEAPQPDAEAPQPDAEAPTPERRHRGHKR